MYLFFFKQKTAYEMRISDWSSDVCSSDLVYRFELDGQVIRTEIARPFVRLEWGLYLFTPSRSALTEIAKPGRTYVEIDAPREKGGRAFLDRVAGLYRMRGV